MVKSGCLKQGDIIIVSFNSTKKYKKKENVYALVVSKQYFNQHTNGNCVYICAIGSLDNGFPLNVPLPVGMKTHGYVFPYQFWSMNLNAYQFKYVEHADEVLIKTVIGYINGALS